MTTPPHRPPGTRSEQGSHTSRAKCISTRSGASSSSYSDTASCPAGHTAELLAVTSMSKSVAVSLTGRSSLSTSAGARPLSRTFILASDSHSSTLTPGSPVHYLSAAYRYRRLANSAVRMSTTTHPGWSVTGEASAPPRAMPPAAAEHPASPGTPGPRSPSSGSDESGVPARGRRRIR